MHHLERCRQLINNTVLKVVMRRLEPAISIAHRTAPSQSNRDALFRAIPAVPSGRPFCPTQKQLRQLHAEQRALLRMLCDSSSIPAYVLARHLHTSARKLDKQQPQKQKPSDRDDDPNRGNKKDDEDDKEKMMSVVTKTLIWMITIYLLVGFLSMVLPSRNRPESATRYVSWHEFVHHMLAVGEVKEVVVHPDMEMVTIILHDGAIVKGRRVQSNIFHMAVADVNKFEEKLRSVEQRLGVKEGVSVQFERSGDVSGRILFTLFATGVIIALLSRIRGGRGPISMDSFTQMGRAKFTLVDPIEGGRGVWFRDVAGLQEAKQEVMEFVDYLKSPGRYQRLGAKVPKGALLLGPPGCGKTLLAKAVATEAQVPFLSMNGSEFIEMIGGLGAARVRDLFKEAKKRSPCIIYVDEIDAIGRQREGGSAGAGGMNSGESEQTLNQLLVEMDGMASKEGVLMLASTNRADILDKALLRPGRFDRHILIDLPNLAERKEIFEKHLSGIALEQPPATYSSRLATLTPGFSGADIANVCNEAALHAARTNQKVVRTANLEYAVERLVGGTEKRSHALSPTERRVIAFHESGHALVGWMLPNSDVLLKVTIVPRTSLALGFAQYTPKEQKLYTREQLFDKMCMALGGRAAENLTFNRITTGAQNDLEKVTKMAYAQIKYFGMNSNVGPIAFAEESDNDPYAKKPYSKSLGNLIDFEARKMITDAYERTEQILRDNSDKLNRLAEALLEKETLNYDQVVELIGPPKYDDAKRKMEPVDFEDSLKRLAQNGAEEK
ncbi:paraplegin [Anopheles stephensi]|uniref:AAA+ ATPase domain-containing protein n=1 Tax=Anopheles stephensi TaxID=30069 RepID=A0A182YK71_ANOST|nr:paraplegin [Anopheles stephensi]XP_035919504.1 paraplegin [Anopheles stephensi]